MNNIDNKPPVRAPTWHERMPRRVDPDRTPVFADGRKAFIGTLPVHVELIELRVIVVASDLDGHSARSTFVVRRVSTDLMADAVTAQLPEPQAAR